MPDAGTTFEQLSPAQKEAVAEQLASAKRNFEVGTTTVTDSREAQARYDLVIAQEIAAENDLRVKSLALDQLVGITGTKPLPLALPVQLPSMVPDNLTTWVDTARDQQPGVRQAAIALDIARLETKRAETGHLPTVDLQAGYNVTRNLHGTITSPGVTARSKAASVGVALNLPLFAGFAGQNRVKETLALETKAEADLETARRNVAQATRSAFFGVQSGQGQVQALEAAARPRLHLFLSTSPLHREHKLRMSRQQVLDMAVEHIAYARKFIDDVEFSTEDGTRTEEDFLHEVVAAAISAGATTINVPDTVGFTTPEEIRGLFQRRDRRTRFALRQRSQTTVVSLARVGLTRQVRQPG